MRSGGNGPAAPPRSNSPQRGAHLRRCVPPGSHRVTPVSRLGSAVSSNRNASWNTNATWGRRPSTQRARIDAVETHRPVLRLDEPASRHANVLLSASVAPTRATTSPMRPSKPASRTACVRPGRVAKRWRGAVRTGCAHRRLPSRQPDGIRPMPDQRDGQHRGPRPTGLDWRRRLRTALPIILVAVFAAQARAGG